jgi:hypothetical protein
MTSFRVFGVLMMVQTACFAYWPTLLHYLEPAGSVKRPVSITLFSLRFISVAYRGRGEFIPPPKFLNFDKAEPNSQFHGKYIHNNLIRVWVSLIFKLNGTPN